MATNIKVTLGSGNEQLEFEDDKLETVETTTQISANNMTVQYKVLASTGQVVARDYDNTLKQKIEDGYDIMAMPISISADNLPISNQIVEDANYDTIDSSIRFNLTDVLVVLDTAYAGLPYQANPRSALEILATIFSNYSVMCDNPSYFGFDFLTYLSKIYIPNSYIPAGITKREALEMLCQLGQFSIAVDKNGMPKLYSNRPIMIDTTPVSTAVVKDSDIVEELDHTILLKNKFDGVTCKVCKFEETETLNTPINFLIDGSANAFEETQENGQRVAIEQDLYGSSGEKRAWTYAQLKMTTKSNLVLNKRTADNLNEIYEFLTETANWKTDNYKWGYSVTGTKKTTFIPFGTAGLGSGEIYPEDERWENYETVEEEITTSFSDEIVYYSQHYPKLNIPFYSPSELYQLNYNFLFQNSLNIRTNLVDISAITGYVISSKMHFYIYGYGARKIEFIPKTLTFSIYGNGATRRYTFDLYQNIKDGVDINNSTKIVNFPNENYLLSEATYVLGEQNYFPKRFTDTILQDYENGRQTGTVTVICSDYYNEFGTLVKNWSGTREKFEVGDTIYYQSEGTYWRVTGQTFIDEGQPRQRLELIRSASTYEVYPVFQQTAYYEGDILFLNHFIATLFTAQYVPSGSVVCQHGIISWNYNGGFTLKVTYEDFPDDTQTLYTTTGQLQLLHDLGYVEQVNDDLLSSLTAEIEAGLTIKSGWRASFYWSSIAMFTSEWSDGEYIRYRLSNGAYIEIGASQSPYGDRYIDIHPTLAGEERHYSNESSAVIPFTETALATDTLAFETNISYTSPADIKNMFNIGIRLITDEPVFPSYKGWFYKKVTR